jgi:cell wall assembly regulator SMI1
MLFLCVFTFDACHRQAVIDRRARHGEKVPDEVKVLMEVADLTKNRVFRLVEAEDLESVEAANGAWRDLCRIETIPVQRSEEMLQTLVGMKTE